MRFTTTQHRQHDCVLAPDQQIHHVHTQTFEQHCGVTCNTKLSFYPSKNPCKNSLCSVMHFQYNQPPVFRN